MFCPNQAELENQLIKMLSEPPYADYKLTGLKEGEVLSIKEYFNREIAKNFENDFSDISDFVKNSGIFKIIE